jgi:hypothetical protein
MPSAEPEWTNAIDFSRERISQYNSDGRAWKLMWSAGGASITHVELRLLRRLAESRRPASFLGGLAPRSRAAADRATLDTLATERHIARTLMASGKAVTQAR